MPKSLMQKLHLYIVFQEIIIPEKQGRKMHFRTTQSKKHFPENVFQTDWAEISLQTWSAKQFLPAGNNNSGNQLTYKQI